MPSYAFTEKSIFVTQHFLLQCLSEAELVGQLSEDFGRSAYQDKPSLPAEKIEVCSDNVLKGVLMFIFNLKMCEAQLLLHAGVDFKRP